MFCWFIQFEQIVKVPVVLVPHNIVQKLCLIKGTWCEMHASREYNGCWSRIGIKVKGINNGNWTEWSAIWSETIGVISKSNEHVVWVRFEITSMISDQNCTTQSLIATSLDPFWNHTIFGEKQKQQSFGNSSCKILHTMTFCLSLSWNFIIWLL